MVQKERMATKEMIDNFFLELNSRITLSDYELYVIKNCLLDTTNSYEIKVIKNDKITNNKTEI